MCLEAKWKTKLAETITLSMSSTSRNPLGRNSSSSFLSNSKPCSHVFVSSLNVLIFRTKGAAPSNRWGHAAAIALVSGCDSMYIHGGRNGEDEEFGELYCYRFDSKHWDKVQSKPHTGR